jgi:AcrR family transcriptional regulator
MNAKPAASSLRSAPPTRHEPRADQPDRKLNILLAAEKLFSERGYHGVSIRDIAAEAGVPLALVGYYYGAKSELYAAIFESWRPMFENRMHGLESAFADDVPAPQRLDRILDAFVTPVLDLQQHPEGRYYALMAARDLAAPTAEADQIHRSHFDPMANAFIDALCRVSPGATRGQVAWCYQFMLGALLHFMTDQRVERLSQGENRAADPAAKAHLLAFIGAGFRAVLAGGAPRKVASKTKTSR